MSRRFGRQQKRRMREQLRRRDEHIVELQTELLQLSALGARNRDIVEKTAKLLGKHFVTLDPLKVELNNLRSLGDWWKVHVMDSPYAYAHIQGKSPDFVDKSLSEIIHLPVMKGRAFLDGLRHVVHFRFRFNGREVGYAVSQNEIALSPHFREHIRRDIEAAAGRMLMGMEVERT